MRYLMRTNFWAIGHILNVLSDLQRPLYCTEFGVVTVWRFQANSCTASLRTSVPGLLEWGIPRSTNGSFNDESQLRS